MSTAITQLIGTLAVLAYIAFILRMDRGRGRAPLPLAGVFITSGLTAAFAAAYVERGAENLALLLLPAESAAFRAVDAFICVALVEELLKFGVLRLFTLREGSVLNAFDGVVYAGVAALGFALFENASYIAAYGSAATFKRVFSAVPGHLADGVIMGYFYGKARERASRGDYSAHRKLCAASVLVPAAEHCVYNLLAGIESKTLSPFFWAYVIIINIAAVLIIWRLAKKT